jgi:hypothetical protein
LTLTIVSVAIFHYVLAVHLRDLAHAVENGIPRVACRAGQGGLVEICTLGIDGETLALAEVASWPALYAVAVAVELGTAVGRGGRGADAVREGKASITAGAEAVIGIVSVTVDVDVFAETRGVHECPGSAGSTDTR